MNNCIEKFTACLNRSRTAYNFIEELDVPKDVVVFDKKYSHLKANTTYFIKVSSSACILIKTPEKVNPGMGFNIFSAHTDSPSLKLKPNFLIQDSNYTRISTEVYGGPIISTWLDIPLTLAGRVFVKDKDEIEEVIVNLKDPLFVIPNMPPHLERTINSGYKYNPQIDLAAIGPRDFSLEKYLNLPKGSIVSHDLFLVPSREAITVGEDYIFSDRIDDLACAFVGVDALFKATPKDKINIVCCFDNEEVGSRTKQGADSTVLENILELIYESFDYSKLDQINSLKESFMISADNAHAINPNHPEKFDSLNKTYLNEGIVVKYNANQSYTTDGLSSSKFKLMCDSLDVKVQDLANRSDIRGGSTLGNIALSHVSIPSVDIGLPQLSMHSTMEVMGQKDLVDAMKIAERFFSE